MAVKQKEAATYGKKLFYEQKEERKHVIYLRNSIFSWSRAIHVNHSFCL